MQNRSPRSAASPLPDEMDQGAYSNNMGIGRMCLLWKHSVYKVVYREVLVFLIVFWLISAVYRNFLDEEQKKDFVVSKHYFQKYTDSLAVPFLLGFYVTTIAERWWQQYLCIPWPDRLMLAINMYVIGDSEEIKSMRLILIRRALLMMTLLLRSISPTVRRRYPTIQSLVDRGIMTQGERQQYELLNPKLFNLYCVPGTWFVSTLKKALNAGILKDEQGTKCVMEEFLEFRTNCGLLWSYNWVNIPIIYTQVCTLSTYTYFMACLISRQHTGPNEASVQVMDIYFPIRTIVEMTCYIGLLNVAEQIKSPFQGRDEDFDLDFLIKRHYDTAELALNELVDRVPHYKDDPPLFENIFGKLLTEDLSNCLGYNKKSDEGPKTKNCLNAG